ncbi:DUF1707 domain-containing protein [Corynebacterium sp. HS2168-gen11]|uniref:DUF1707 SHOCT-like domain-containing protein n=1 Tax=Corynebacterium sp. HS2168-gen11 TaxID=2974027 RepID=UPI00216B5DC9|nr:DUF1707 domain-containing protein [Corynebacterium sp. HS2168-gen11]MCS4536007.1 DUF1707 domain-containing protein [Corynebacterium sp. HS2168-gen11]
MNMPSNPEYRLTDQERAEAIDALAKHVAAGRIDLDEYEIRVDIITSAVTHGDLEQVFYDLPPAEDTMQEAELAAMYTRAEIYQAYKDGKRIRLGILLLSTFAVLSIEQAFHSQPSLFFIVGVTLYILLYLIKIGPSSWYTPSPRELARQRQRDLEMAYQEHQQRIRMLSAKQRAELTAFRAQKRAEIANHALEMTENMMRKLNKPKGS